MNICFITLYHTLTSSMVQPTHTSSYMNLPLVVGTSDNLYKAMEDDKASPASKINSIIVELWLEKIEFLLEKIIPLEKQISNMRVDPADKPLYFRVEYLAINVVALRLTELFERLDKTLMALMLLGEKGMDTDKYENFLLYFGDKLSELMNFPYQQSPELQQRILRSSI